jgi:signal transduction histidine kinase
MAEAAKLGSAATENMPSPVSAAGQPAWFVLIEAIERLSAAQTFEQIQEIVRLGARAVSGADGVTFVLRDGDRCHYVEENAIGPLWRGQKFPMTSCISGWAMLNKRTAVVPDIYVDPRIPHDAYRPTFVKSLMMAPVRVEDPVAAIGAYWAREYEPSPNEIALLESLARATSIAIANVTLQNSLRDAAETAQGQAEEIRRSYDELRQETEKRQQTEAQLRQAQKMEAIGQLTGGMAHDFNNLLTVIIGSLDLLVAGPADGPQVKSLAGSALEAAVRGADLIRRLLAFARRQPLEPQRVDINELVRKMSTLLERTLGQHIKITLDLSPEVWPVIVDPAQLETSLANLATNARDAMPNGGSLRFATSNRHLDEDYASSHRDVTVGDYAMIEVNDSGTGIPGALLSRIFEPFFTTKDPGKGTGLGLSMVFGFMKQSGGHINLYSEEGIGTTFRLYLPRSRDEAASAAPRPVETAEPGHGETILLVEDDLAIRRLAVHQLITLNYRVVEAVDVETALMALEQTRVDLLLTDLIMPGGRGGYDLVLEARQRWPELKVILTSGLPDVRLRDDPAIAKLPLLTKPYRKLDLARALHKALSA